MSETPSSISSEPMWPRLLLCLAMSIAIAATAYYCAWLQYRNSYFQHSPQYLTCKDLEMLRQEIEQYRQQTGAWPKDLKDLKATTEKHFRIDEEGRPHDRWFSPFQYKVDAGGYTLWSFGADRQAGGDGDDADLYAGDTEKWKTPPTFERFQSMPKAKLALI